MDVLANSPELADFDAPIRVIAARQAIEEGRKSIVNGFAFDCMKRAIEIASNWCDSSYRYAINCTGTIINTGLGRSALNCLSMPGHAILEVDSDSGERGDRQKPLRDLLCQLTGAESAYVVNNNAAAVMLVLNTLCTHRDVLLSRGQSVEIGGSFRMPDVIRISEVGLIDVGCTNKTRISDYENAITEKTAAILRCHPSNFVMKGFVEEPSIKEMADCAHRNGILMIDDNGSGCLINTERYGLPHEPTLQEAVKAGVDIVTASGDKLLGGPQSGIILGKKELIEKIAKNPLARALRIDKTTAGILAFVLKQYVLGKEESLPTIQALSKKKEDLRKIAEQFLIPGVEIEDSICEVGGGSMPGVEIPSVSLSIKCSHPQELSKKLRKNSIFGYVRGEALKLELRTLLENEFPILIRVLKESLES